MLRTSALLALLIVAMCSTCVADSSIPTVFVLGVTNTLTAAIPSPTPNPSDIQNSIVAALNGSLKFDASSSVGIASSGFVVLSTMSDSQSDPSKAAHIFLNLTTLKEPGSKHVSDETIDITGRKSPYYVTQAEAVQAITGNVGPPRIPAQVVLIDDGLNDTNTAKTTFNGPAYVESRLIEELAIHDLSAASISDYLFESSSGSATGSSVFTSGDDAFAAGCLKDNNLVGLRYKLQYQENTNPLFGLQNGSAQLLVRLQRCNEIYQKAPQFSVPGKHTNISNKGLLNLQYFQLLNFLLNSIRKNSGAHGFFGTGGLIASSLLPAAPDTAAESAAVGEAARRAACAVDMYLRGKQSLITSEVIVVDNTNKNDICDIDMKSQGSSALLTL